MLLSITKLQNLKAIHNGKRSVLYYFCVVINYKIWKQFTTRFLKDLRWALLLSITKLQNLKAIHNGLFYRNYLYFVVINRKTTKFESNSQPGKTRSFTRSGCYQSQNYKIWKQFTTEKPRTLWVRPLLSITKLQNLKAIHN